MKINTNKRKRHTYQERRTNEKKYTDHFMDSIAKNPENKTALRSLIGLSEWL